MATSTPQGTPSTVPSSRCQPLVSVSAQELVPAKITNAAITAQYQRVGDNNSPATMVNDAATAHLDGLAGGLQQAPLRRLVIGCGHGVVGGFVGEGLPGRRRP